MASHVIDMIMMRNNFGTEAMRGLVGGQSAAEASGCRSGIGTRGRGVGFDSSSCGRDDRLESEERIHQPGGVGGQWGEAEAFVDADDQCLAGVERGRRRICAFRCDDAGHRGHGDDAAIEGSAPDFHQRTGGNRA